MRAALMAALVIGWASPTAAQTDGNWLLSLCQGTPGNRPAMCTGVVSGMVLGLRAATVQALHHYGGANENPVSAKFWQTVGFCIPAEATFGQTAEVVTTYMQNHPERLHFDAAFLVRQALIGAFPCAQ